MEHLHTLLWHQLAVQSVVQAPVTSQPLTQGRIITTRYSQQHTQNNQTLPTTHSKQPDTPNNTLKTNRHSQQHTQNNQTLPTTHSKQPDTPNNTLKTTRHSQQHIQNNLYLNTRLVISVRLTRYLLCCLVVHVFHARGSDFIHCPLLTTPPSRTLSSLQWLVEHVFPAREQTAFP